jgi:hypothetical protein
MNFAKITHDLTFEDIRAKHEYVSYGGRIKYSTVDLTTDVLQAIPQHYRDKFLVSLMEINNNIPPHTDSNIKCTINFYIKSGNFETKFWKVKEGVKTNTYKIKNQTNGSVFDISCLTFDDSFIALPGEAYLLDVTKPHSVTTESVSERVAICVQTDFFTFDEVKNMLVSTGYI